MENKKGFTLIELIVPIAIFGLITVTLISVFSNSFINIVRAGKRTEVVSRAETVLHGEGSTVIEDRTVIVSLPIIDENDNEIIKDIDVEVSLVEGTAIDDTLIRNILEVKLKKYNSKGSD
jgi:prepilin-type N-terminal cleavage/methylation domain-containing protein